MAKILDKLELIERLTPLVIPMIYDQAMIGYPISSNVEDAGVHIRYRNHSVVLTSNQYELLRIHILQYFVDQIGVTDDMIKTKLSKVFKEA